MKTFADFDDALAVKVRTVLPGVQADDPIIHVIDMLRVARDGSAAVDDVLIRLLLEERSMTNVYEADELRLLHRAPTDVLISDVKESDIHDIGLLLGKPNLGKASLDHYPSARGIMYGCQKRIFVSLPVRKRDVVKDVLFLFDTGSQATHLCHDTFVALGYNEHVPRTGAFHVNGVLSQASLSRDHYQDVNILGQEYMRDSRARLLLDYDRLEAHFDRLDRSPH